MCYKKKREREQRAEANHRAYKQVLTLQLYVVWQNATAGGCKAQSQPGESISWQSGGGRVKFVG